MNETRNLSLGSRSRIANTRTLKSMIDSALAHSSGMSTSFADSTIGISLDARGDWTISISLSLKSDRFHLISSGLETIGFFQATENQGTSYFLWTSVLAQIEDPRTAIEQVLEQAVKILQATPVSPYIS